MSMPKTKKMAFMAVLTAIALGIFMLEAQLPSPVPVPGVKLGLANVITLAAICILGRGEAAAVLVMRILLGAVFAGSPSTLLFSAMGGAVAYALMCVLTALIPRERLYVTSALSAVGHNVGQLLACQLVVHTPGIWGYFPILAASGIITGLFTGIAAKYLLQALDKSGLLGGRTKQ